MPWRLAVAAVAVTAVAAVCAVTVGTGHVPGAVHLVVLAVVALPLLRRTAPASFCRACLLAGMVLLWVSLLGAKFGLGPVVLASFLLLAASVADRDNPPDGTSVALAAVLPPVFFVAASCISPH
ncbi:hypothetical protein [Streptomyces virginiae]|uniref:hypothetical protein n=1 Tax=Streptomyces virginiae TaxID=1961 RepID=UPI00343C6221